MKKSLFLMAAAALTFTACTSDDSFDQITQKAATEEVGVGFDVYVPGSTEAQTRAGRTNVLKTQYFQRTGFGVFAYVHEDGSNYQNDKLNEKVVPNFMWNQQIHYNSGNSAWYYAPLKYWPNETGTDSQTTPATMPKVGSGTNIDRLSFFAYAPWVATNDGGTTASPIEPNDPTEATAGIGIHRFTKKDGTMDGGYAATDPRIYYNVALDPNYSVDLLWGVAPVGGLKYTAVNKEQISIEEGDPLIDLVKPAVNTNLKFLFQHALARLGVKIVAAVDQVAAGGKLDVGSTKITVEEIAIKGQFATKGVLNMNNKGKKNVANWVESSVTKANTDETSLKINTSTNSLAQHLRYDPSLNTSHQQQTVTGVVPDLADAIRVSSILDHYNGDYTEEETNPAYSAIRPFWDTNDAINGAFQPYNDFAKVSGRVYLQQFTTPSIAATNHKAYTNITKTISVTYPNATVWQNIYSIPDANIQIVNAGNREGYKSLTAYRRVGTNYIPTGQVPAIGDFVFVSGSGPYYNYDPDPVSEPTFTGTKYKAKPNYFMIIPSNNFTGDETARKTVDVKITYWVSTLDPNVKDGIVYTKNVVEKRVVLPHLQNGSAYELKLILGLTSVKIEAEATDWVTTNTEVNLPQNISE